MTKQCNCPDCNLAREQEQKRIMEWVKAEKRNQHNKDCIICWNLIEGLKQYIQEEKKQ